LCAGRSRSSPELPNLGVSIPKFVGPKNLVLLDGIEAADPRLFPFFSAGVAIHRPGNYANHRRFYPVRARHAVSSQPVTPVPHSPLYELISVRRPISLSRFRRLLDLLGSYTRDPGGTPHPGHRDRQPGVRPGLDASAQRHERNGRADADREVRREITVPRGWRRWRRWRRRWQGCRHAGVGRRIEHGAPPAFGCVTHAR
jgi:hypothetical protein